MKEITLPTVHLNGTDKKDLCKDYDNALRRVEEAIEAVAKIEFHSRDYYPQGNQAWNKAVEERMDIRKKLKEVEEYFTAHLEHIYG
jgi:hypothetical protein